MPRYATPLDRLRAHVRVLPSGCWHWTGSRIASNGRPRIAVRIKGRAQWITVARYVVEFVHGRRWTRRTVGAHRCDNLDCANPEHISASTQRRNIRECVERGRHVSGFVVSRGIYAGRRMKINQRFVGKNPTPNAG